MMKEYNPDRWVMVEINSQEFGKIRKILASWYGGFMGSDSWKLSSGNTDVIDKGKYYEFPQESGSVYICHKESVGMSGYTSHVFASWQKQLKEAGDSTMEIVEDYLTKV